ncbi:MAG: PilZ domain-containing protein [Sandaracinaceae bacterium]
MRERRRQARLRCSFDLQILGLDSRAVRRTGDISQSGLFVDLDRCVGEPGTIRRLRVRTRDGAVRFEIDARIARVTSSDDLLRGFVITGVGFELIIADGERRAAVDRFCAHVAKETIELARGAQRLGAATVETDWPLRKGERVAIEVPSEQGHAVRCEGVAVRSRRSKSGSYRTRVEWSEAEPAPTDRSVGGIRDAMKDRVPQLTGDLGAFTPPTLLAFASMEQMSGELVVEDVTVWLSRGDVVDVTATDRACPPLDLLAEVCRRDRGRFALYAGRVERPNRVGTSTTALLIDLARQHDELQRVA